MRKGLVIFCIWLVTIAVFSGYANSSRIQCIQMDTAVRNKVSSDHIWSLPFGSPDGNDQGHSIIQCSDGGFLLVGQIWNQESADILLLHVNDVGQIQWTRSIGGNGIQVATDVIECQSGGFAIIGWGYPFDWYQRQGLNYHEALLVRTNATGDVIWFQSYGGNASYEAYSLVECEDGGFAFAGSIQTIGDDDADFWLGRSDNEGNLLWNRTFGGSDDDRCYSLVERVLGGFVLAGNTESYGAGNEDIWLISTDHNGILLWQRTFGSYRQDLCYQMIQNRQGGFTLVGATDNTPDLQFDVFIINTLPLGTEYWNCTFDEDIVNRGYSIIECQDGGFAVTGSAEEWVANQLTENLLLAYLDSTGEFQWSKTYGGWHSDFGWSIIQAENGDFVVAGTTRSYGEGGSDAWLLRLPNTPPPQIYNRNIGLPNLFLIGLGVLMAALVLFGTYGIYFQSRRAIDAVWINPPRTFLQKTYRKPRLIEELAAILTGYTNCSACLTANLKAQANCEKCGAHLHRCMFCFKSVEAEDLVVFCPSCKRLAHQEEMIQWLNKRNYCPQCGLYLS